MLIGLTSRRSSERIRASRRRLPRITWQGDSSCEESSRSSSRTGRVVWLPRSQREHHFIDIAPAPLFVRLDRTHDRMSSCVKVLCRMFIPGIIAARYMSAYQTHAQMHPGIAHIDTFLTDVSCRLQKFDLIEMAAFFRVHRLFVVTSSLRIKFDETTAELQPIVCGTDK